MYLGYFLAEILVHFIKIIYLRLILLESQAKTWDYRFELITHQM
jgi:hypothetical protein